MSTTDDHDAALAPLDDEIEVELEDSVGRPTGPARLLHDRRPQACGHSLHRTRRLRSSSSPASSRSSCAPSSPSRTRRSCRADLYNQLFTMHGTTMIFLFNTPVLAGFGNYLLPLHDRRPRHGFPASQRVQLLGLPVLGALHVRELRRRQSAQWWLVRVRAAHATSRYSPGVNLDFWGLGVHLRGHLVHRRRGQLHRHHRSSCARRA